MAKICEVTNPYQSPTATPTADTVQASSLRTVFIVVNALIAILLVALGLLNVLLPHTGADFRAGVVLSVVAAAYAILELVAYCGQNVAVERVLGIVSLGIATLPALGIVAFVIGSFIQDDPRNLPSLAWRMSVASCFAVVSAYFISSGWCRLRWTRRCRQ